MFDDEERDDGWVERIADALRAPVPASTDFTDRVMANVAATAGAAPGAGASRWRRLVAARLSLSPAGALAAAAAIAGLAVLGTVAVRGRARTPALAGAVASSHERTARVDTVHVVRFVFLAPSATSVAIVGDFNNWERGVTPLRRVGNGGTWTVSLPLRSGVHQYAFIVDGSTWMPDPATSTTVTDDFGTLTSVIAIGGGAS